MPNKKHVLSKNFVTVIGNNPRYLDREDDSLMKYLDEVRNYKILNFDDELELIKQYKLHGSQTAKEKVINSNLRIVIAIAKRYCPSDGNITDLISEGNIGLITALESYNIDSNVRLATYASSYIVKYILEFLANNSFIKQLNRDRVHGAIDKIEETFFRENDYYPTVDELMFEFKKRYDWMPKDKHDLEKISISFISGVSGHTESYDNDEDIIEYGEEDKNIEGNIDNAILLQQLSKVMLLLTDDEKAVIIKRYGLEDGFERNNASIANELGLSHAQVTNIEKRAIKKLKKYKNLLK